MCQPDVAAYDGVLSYGDTTEYGGIGIDGNIVFKNRVSRSIDGVAFLVGLEVLCAERNALI